jgi:predicted nucleic acid-binding protein
MRPVLVDTDVFINFLRGKPAAKEFLVAQLEEGPIFCSVITIAEIVAGMRPHEKEKTKALLNNLEVVDVNLAIAEKAGHYKGSIKSHALELDDCLIAATAHVRKLTLATCNGRHYPMDDVLKVVVACE